jgi:hypothetical protein
MAVYGSIVVTTVDVVNSPNVLEGFNSNTGAVAWTWKCDDGEASYFTNTNYVGAGDSALNGTAQQYVSVECASGTKNINPQTGQPQ